MKSKYFVSIFILILSPFHLCFSTSLFAATHVHQLPSKQKKEVVAQQKVVDFYLDKKKQFQLKVEIPKGYKSVPLPKDSAIMEFIPENNQDPYQWSEIITLSKIEGKKIPALNAVNFIVEGIKRSTQNAKVLESFQNESETESESEFESEITKGNKKSKQKQTQKRTQIQKLKYQESYSAMQYETNGRNEILVIYAVSTEDTLVTIQYAYHLRAKESMGTNLLKLKRFLSDYVSINNKLIFK